MKKRIVSLLLDLVLLLGLIPAASADEGSVPQTTGITVFATIGKDGSIVTGKDGKPVAEVPVVLTGQDSYTLDDALEAVHEMCYPGGAAAGYSSYASEYGQSLSMLWGDTSYWFGYQVNQGAASVMNLDYVLADGDFIDAYVMPSGESYSFFNKTTATAYVGAPLELTLQNHTYGPAPDYTLSEVPCEGAVITVGGAATETTTAADGKASISFDTAGTYVVSAFKNTVTGEGESARTIPVITAPVCVVTVLGDLPVTLNDGTAIGEAGLSYALGAAADTLKVVTSPDYTGYTYQWKTKNAPDAASSSTVSGGKTQTVTPATTKDSLLYYYCEVKLGSRKFTSALVPVKVSAGAASVPVITKQPVGGTYLAGSTDVPKLTVTVKTPTDGGKLSYQWYAKIGDGRFAAADGAVSNQYTPAASAAGSVSFYCEVTNVIESVSGKIFKNSITTDTIQVVFQDAAEFGAGWEGEGSKESPYLLKTQEDIKTLEKLCNTEGLSFAGKYFRITADLTLPEDWTPLGTDPKTNPFSGSIDGGGFTLTVPEGGKTLIGAPVEAALTNLKIYGVKIEGNGVVDIYTTGVKGKKAITIENVTLKTGTKTLKSGFVGGYGPGDYPVVIRNCTVEPGVIVGYDGTQSNIGSFGGDFNGTIEGCVSHAAVNGVNFVGGIAGSKGQSMGDYLIRDCIFGGTVTATGNYAGGISGHGYGGSGWGFTANAGWPTIQNCLVTGSVVGANYVGGILGAEAGVSQCWGNGVGYIQNNCLTGTVSATAEGAYLGGIIGYLKSVDSMTVLSNNHYLSTCGAQSGIGAVAAVDSSAKYGRTDVTEQTASEAFTQAFAQADEALIRALNAGRNSSGDWVLQEGTPAFGGHRHLVSIKTDPALGSNAGFSIQTGNELSDETHKLVLTYSDGTTETIAQSQAVRENCDFSQTGYRAAALVYNNREYVFLLNVKTAVTSPSDPGPTNPSNTITVTFTLLGDTVHDAGSVHTNKAGNLTPWISGASVTVPAGSTVMAAIGQALTRQGYSWISDDVSQSVTGNYIQSVTNPQGVTLAEFTNGPSSGWMYTLNGAYTEIGVQQQKLADGDVIVLHYTDNYTMEQASESFAGGTTTTQKTEETSEQETQTAAKHPFTDVTGHWSESAVQYVWGKNLMNGTAETAFGPELTTSRAMVATILYRLEGEPAVTADSAFHDVTAGQWYTDAIAWAAEKGIVTGYEEGAFGPDGDITREQMAVILFRYAQFKGMEAVTLEENLHFSDASQISGYAVSAMNWAVGQGLITGMADGTLAPRGTATRAQIAAILMRYLNK